MPPTDDFVAVADAARIAPGKLRAFQVHGREVLVCNVGGQLFALEDRCTHAAVKLSDGRLRGCVLECPLHGGKFDVRDGSVRSGPPMRALATFPVRVRDGHVEVGLG